MHNKRVDTLSLFFVMVEYMNIYLGMNFFIPFFNLVPRAFPSKNGWGREKALASAGHVCSLNIHINGNV